MQRRCTAVLVHFPMVICGPHAAGIAPSALKQGDSCIAGYSAYASAAKFAEGRGATTSQVLKHLTPCEDFAAEACAE